MLWGANRGSLGLEANLTGEEASKPRLIVVRHSHAQGVARGEDLSLSGGISPRAENESALLVRLLLTRRDCRQTSLR